MTSPLRDALRQRLTEAMRARDRRTVSAMRTVLAALENAEAVPEAPHAGPVASSEHVAGAATGPGAGDAPRRDLSSDDERLVVAREVAELRSSAAALGEAGQRERSAELALAADTVEAVLEG